MIKKYNPEEISHRAVKSGLWAFSIRLVDQVLYLIRLTVLARLLSPHDFGLMGIAMLTVEALDTFSQTGFPAALIQKKERTNDFLDSAWTAMIARDFLLFIILLILAPYAAAFFKAPESKLIIQAFSFSILFKAFSNIGVIHFQKELEFNKQFVYEVSGILTHFIVQIVLAVILRNAWALVFGYLARHLVRLVVSYIIHPHRPHFRIEPDKIRELFSFGKWILGSAILIFLVTQGDDILVGNILGASMLGFYQLAYKISSTPTTEISQVIAGVTFPAYSKLQDDKPRLKEGYLKVFQMTTFLAFPLTGLIFILAPEFVMVFLGAKWKPIIPAMQVLALGGLVGALIGTSSSLFQGIGKPKIETKWSMTRLALLAVTIYPLTKKWGILGTSLAVFLSQFFSNIGFSWNTIKIIQVSIKKYIKLFLIPLTSIVFSVLVLWALQWIIPNGVFGFIIQACLGILIYIALIILAEKLFNYKILFLIKNTFSALAKSDPDERIRIKH